MARATNVRTVFTSVFPVRTNGQPEHPCLHDDNVHATARMARASKFALALGLTQLPIARATAKNY